MEISPKFQIPSLYAVYHGEVVDVAKLKVSFAHFILSREIVSIH